MPVDGVSPHGKRAMPIPNQGFGGDPVSGLTGSKNLSSKEKLSVLAHEFESVLMNQMLRSMRATIEKADLIDGGHAEEIYQDLLDEQFARHMAYSQTGGLAETLTEQMAKALPEEKQPVEKPDTAEHTTKKFLEERNQTSDR